MKKFLTAYVEKDAIAEDGTIPLAVASDSSIDRDGEIIDPAGLDTTNYERNPVLLYAHDYRSDPIGKTIAIKKDGSRVLFTPQLAIDISERAKMYFQMIKEGVLNAFSIGFIAKEWTDRANADGSSTRIFTKTELLEISLVPVPANPNALVLAREYVGKMEGDQKQIGEQIITDMEAATKEAEEKDKCATTMEEMQKEISEMRGTITVLETKIAANKGAETGAKAAGVEELLRHPNFHRGVLAAVDKALGQSLGRMKTRK
jgi:HK97 family phage prohead protease